MHPYHEHTHRSQCTCYVLSRILVYNPSRSSVFLWLTPRISWLLYCTFDRNRISAPDSQHNCSFRVDWSIQTLIYIHGFPQDIRWCLECISRYHKKVYTKAKTHHRTPQSFHWNGNRLCNQFSLWLNTCRTLLCFYSIGYHYIRWLRFCTHQHPRIRPCQLIWNHLCNSWKWMFFFYKIT